MRASRLLAGLVAIAVAVPAAVATPSASAATRYLEPVFAEVEAIPDLLYGHAVDYAGQPQDLYLDLYQPKGDTETLRPVFIWAHGGFFTEGDKSQIGVIKDFMTTRGWVTLSMNYRLNPTLPEGFAGYSNSKEPFYDLARLGEEIRDAQHDMQAAVRWVRANAATYGLDPDRIATGGFSAGATMSMAVAYNSDDPGDSGNPGYPSDVTAAIGTGTLNVPFVDIHPDPGVEPPAAMFHGQDDMSPYLGPVTVCLVAQALLNVCDVHIYPGEGHSSRNGLNDWPAFLYEWVVQKTPSPVRLPSGALPPLPSVHFPSASVPRVPLP